MVVLRPYQTDAQQRCREAFAAGHRRVVLQAPTGSGKTLIAADIIRLAVQRGRTVLFVAHRREILAQTCRKLTDAGVTFATLTAGKPVPDAQVIVASMQTLARRDVPARDLVIVDEAHANVTQQLRLQAALPDAWHLLLTATPARLDGKPLPADAIVEAVPLATLRDDGYLVPWTIYAPEAPDLSAVPVRRGEFEPAGLSLAFDRPELTGAVADNWRRWCHGRRGLLFATSVRHSLSCRDALRAAGYRAEHVDGTTSAADRADAWLLLEQGRLDVVCTVGVAIEGLDLPRVDAIYLARATASLTVYMQAIGRGMRTAEGKADLVVVDAGGNVWRHDLPEHPRVWSLTERVAGTKAETALQLRQCAECLAVWSGEPVCPRCGAVVQCKPRQGPRTVDGELRPVTAAEMERRRRADSREVPPRPCPPWARSKQGMWDGLERKRHREGYALGDGSGWRGWTQAMVRRALARG